MPRQPFKATIADLPREYTREATSGSAVLTDSSIFVFHWAEEGMVHEMHEHPEDQLAIVFEGTLEIEIEIDGEGVVHTVKPGELVYIPANVRHTGRTIGNERLVVLSAYSPIKPDFLHLAAHQPGAAEYLP